MSLLGAPTDAHGLKFPLGFPLEDADTRNGVRFPGDSDVAEIIVRAVVQFESRSRQTDFLRHLEDDG